MTSTNDKAENFPLRSLTSTAVFEAPSKALMTGEPPLEKSSRDETEMASFGKKQQLKVWPKSLQVCVFRS